MTILKSISLAAALLMGSVSLPASATILAPVNLSIGAKTRATTLQVTNDGLSQMSIDVRVYHWLDTDDKGVDQLEPTDRVIPSRPVLTVDPGKTVTVRFLVTERSDKAQDNYRVVLNDVTPMGREQVAVRVKQILPLFIINKGSARAQVKFENGTITNIGERHIRITSYRNSNKDKVDLLRYVLPGKSVRIPVSTIEDVTYNEPTY